MESYKYHRNNPSYPPIPLSEHLKTILFFPTNPFTPIISEKTRATRAALLRERNKQSLTLPVATNASMKNELRLLLK